MDDDFDDNDGDDRGNDDNEHEYNDNQILTCSLCFHFPSCHSSRCQRCCKNKNYDENVNEDEEIIIIIIRTWSQLGHNVLVNNHKHKILIQHICCMVQLTIKTIKETTASCVP